MISINKIHVHKARRTKQNRIARGLTNGRMRRPISLSKVSFRFDDTACENSFLATLRIRTFPSKSRATLRGSRSKKAGERNRTTKHFGNFVAGDHFLFAYASSNIPVLLGMSFRFHVVKDVLDRAVPPITKVVRAMPFTIVAVHIFLFHHPK